MPNPLSLKAPAILTGIGAFGMALGVKSCAVASSYPGGSDGSTTYGLWGVFGFSVSALLFAAGALWLIIAAISRR